MADDAFVCLLKHLLSQLDCEILFLRHEIEETESGLLKHKELLVHKEDAKGAITPEEAVW